MNSKGYTLVELLATMVILGILMAVTIPNISGISTQNKITTYAEDAKKFKSTVEYMLRGDDTLKKPKVNGDCVLVNLKYVHGNDYDHPPYGGEYLMDKSIVVMTKEQNRYKYYVQLVEKFISEGVENYRGFSLLEYSELEGDKYLTNISESSGNMGPFFDIKYNQGNILNFTNGNGVTISEVVHCNNSQEVYYAA